MSLSLSLRSSLRSVDVLVDAADTVVVVVVVVIVVVVVE